MNGPMRILATVTAVALLVAFSPLIASADTIFSYTGQHYTDVSDSSSPLLPGAYDTNMYVSATLLMADVLSANFDGYVAPIHSTVSDGLYTLSDQTCPSCFFHFHFTTDAEGLITNWAMSASDTSSAVLFYIRSYNDPNLFSSVTDFGRATEMLEFSAQSGSNTNAPGIWVDPPVTPVPEASSLTLLVAGLAALGYGVHRKLT